MDGVLYWEPSKRQLTQCFRWYRVTIWVLDQSYYWYAMYHGFHFFSGNVAHSTIVSLGDLQNKSRNVRNTPWCRRDTGCEGVSLVSSGDRHVLETQRSYRFIPCEPIDWWVWGIWTHIWNYQILSDIISRITITIVANVYLKVSTHRFFCFPNFRPPKGYRDCCMYVFHWSGERYSWI